MTIQKIQTFRCRQKAWPFRVVCFLLFSFLLGGCATPSDKLDLLATEHNFQRTSLRAKGFDLRVYTKNTQVTVSNNSVANKLQTMHVYLEGDGSPWRHRTIIMPDPTPKNPLMLRLMALDKMPSVYIGRPCYNGTSLDSGCDNRLWTSARYSTQVVNSMAAAIKTLAKRYKPEEIRLFGHSGGGALALLLAQEIPLVNHVVTIAGNLDIEAWTTHHGYTPLYSSLNPAEQPPLRTQVKQWHFLGGRDAVIPVQLIKPFILSQPSASGFLYEGYGHGCCWSSIWPTVLDALENQISQSLRDAQFKYSERLEGVLDSQ